MYIKHIHIRVYVIPCPTCGKIRRTFTKNKKEELLKLYKVCVVRTLLCRYENWTFIKRMEEELRERKCNF
jgi:hypothetical protein